MSGCAQPGALYYPGVASRPANLADENRTAMGASASRVEQLTASPGSAPGLDQPVPVLDEVFDERAFFGFDQDTPLPGAQPILDRIAAEMRGRGPRAALTILGHTDAVGSDAYNVDLSRRRAATIMSRLIDRGLDPSQLSTVAIGKGQPIASNRTEEGRARNRRVEFMISSSEQANLAVVRDRGSPAAGAAEILKPVRRPASPDDAAILGQVGILSLRRPEADQNSGLRTAAPVARRAVPKPGLGLRPAAPAEPPPVARPAEPLPAYRQPSDPTSY